MVKAGGTEMGCSLKVKNTYYYSLSVVLVCILLFSFVPTVRADDVTLINFSPSQKIVQFGSEFSIDILCTPTQAVKAYEFQLQFDPSYLEALSVSEGDIFEGYPTFFNSGVIDNAEGVITNLFGLIVGPGNVSDPGSLVSVTFHAKSNAGLSTLSLVNVGVTNEMGYISIEKQNGVIIVYDPASSHVISPISPVNKSQDIEISTSQLGVAIYDLEGDPFDWIIYTSPNIGSNSGTNSLNGTKTCSISGLTYSTTYTWYVHCRDTITGNWTNRSFWFDTVDEEYVPPVDNGGDNGYVPPFSPGEEDENNPPSQPMKPVGPTSIELGVVYSYSSFAMDVDGDLIRLKFDWGDGSYSSWSGYVSSNTTVEMNHNWGIISNYNIRVLAQDEQGENSSWSESLEVIVSQVEIPDDDNSSDDSGIVEILNINDTTYFFIDSDNDGVIDIFYNLMTGFNSSVGYLDDKNILLDTDGDGIWDHKYNLEQKSLSSYSSVSGESPAQISFFEPWFLILISLSVLLGVMVLFRHEINLFILRLRLSILQSKSSSLSHTKRLAVRADSSPSKHHRVHFFSSPADKKQHIRKEHKKLDEDKKLKTKLYHLDEKRSFDDSFKSSDVDYECIDNYSRMTSHPVSPLSKKFEDGDLSHETIRSKIDMVLGIHEEHSTISDIERAVDRLLIDKVLSDKKFVL